MMYTLAALVPLFAACTGIFGLFTRGICKRLVKHARELSRKVPGQIPHSVRQQPVRGHLKCVSQ